MRDIPPPRKNEEKTEKFGFSGYICVNIPIVLIFVPFKSRHTHRKWTRDLFGMGMSDIGLV